MIAMHCTSAPLLLLPSFLMALFSHSRYLFSSLSLVIYTLRNEAHPLSAIFSFFFFFSFSSFVSLTLAVWFIESPTEYEIISYKHSLSTVFFFFFSVYPFCPLPPKMVSRFSVPFFLCVEFALLQSSPFHSTMSLFFFI